MQYQLNSVGPLGKKVKEIILQTDNILIYMDEGDTIQWHTEGYEHFPDHFGEIQNKVSYWESLSNELFNPRISYDLKCGLAEAYARILDNEDIGQARDIIDRTSERITKRGNETLKQAYSISSLLATFIVVTLVVVAKLNRPLIVKTFGLNEYCFILTSLFGGIGAFIFTIIRLKNYLPDILVNRFFHQLDGTLRIVYGNIAGLIVAIGIKSNLILGFLNTVDKSIYISAFIGIIAGASEVLIPNLVKQMEGKVKIDATPT